MAEQRTIQAKEAFIQNRLIDALDNNKNVWCELRKLGILSKASDQLHGFTPNELNKHFAGVSVSHSELETDSDDILTKASDGGSIFMR